MALRQNFLDGTLAGELAQLLGVAERPFDLLLSAIRLPSHSRARSARRGTVMIIVSPRSISSSSRGRWVFGLGGLNFACHRNPIGLSGQAMSLDRARVHGPDAPSCWRRPAGMAFWRRSVAGSTELSVHNNAGKAETETGGRRGVVQGDDIPDCAQQVNSRALSGRNVACWFVLNSKVIAAAMARFWVPLGHVATREF